MPLILAIEPDKRQASQLTGLVKGLQAELVLRGNAGDGLAALEGRVPDLVLTTSLISPRDDSALAAHLRELGAAAAHVQTVTIPLLGASAPKRAKGGMLAALRREKPQEPMTDGCAPEVFAEQVRQYLATAEEQKLTAATRVAVVPETVEAFETAAPAEPIEAAQPFEAVEPVQALPAAELETAPAEELETAPAEAFEAAAPELIAPEPETLADALMGMGLPEEFAADEPSGLPLSQLLQLVSETAPAIEPVAAVAPGPELIEPEPELVAAPERQPLVELEPVAELTPVDLAPAEEIEPVAELAPAATFDDLYVDPVAAQALDELSRQAPQSSLGDGIPAEVPVPVVEMHSFQSLDAIASELAAGPAQRHESLDDLASLFAASPPPKPSYHEAAPIAPPAQELTAPLHGDMSDFASLFAQPAPAAPPAPIEVPGIDPSLFATAPGATARFEPEPVAFTRPAFEIETFDAADLLAPEPEAALAPEPVFETAPEPVLEAAPLSVFEVAPEPERIVAPTADEPASEWAAIDEPAPLPAQVLAEFTVPEPEPEPEPELEPESGFEPAVAADAQPESASDDTLVSFEPVVLDSTLEEPDAVAAAPAFDDEEVSLDVDSFAAALAEPQPPAEPERFSFTFVDGFGDAWSDFEVPTIGAMAADLGVGEHPPLDPYAAAPRAAAPAPLDPQGAPALDEEALSLIGDAAHKVGLDALVIEEFERGYTLKRAKKVKKKPAHAGATQVPAAPAERPAKPAKRPVQDEWGMFDPEQCGFAALEDEDGTENRPTTGTRVRVISY